MRFKKIVNYTLILILILATLGIYLDSLKGEFLIDDYSGILKNERIHDIKIYFSKYFQIRPGALYEAAHVLLWRISDGSPYCFHLFNVLMHTGCVILLFVLCNILFKNKTLAFLASLIFAIHPIHTEAISWISGGHYAFSGLFFITAMIFYVHPVRNVIKPARDISNGVKSSSSIFYLTWAVIFFGLCIFAGNAAATLPLMFIAYDLFFKEKKEPNLKIIRASVLFLILAVAVVFALTFFVRRKTLVHTIYYFKGPGYLVVIAKALVYYLKILYLPIQRGLYHPFAYNTTDTNKITPAFFASLAVIVGSLIFFFRCRQRNKPVSFGIAWFYIAYLPYSNIVPICNIVSERYMYLPSAGFSLVLAYLFLKVWEIINRSTKFRQALRIAAMVALILFLSSYAILTIMHNRDYQDLLTYWQTNIQNFPDGYMAYNNLAGTYYEMGNFEQAIAYCWVNLMIKPDQPHVWCNLGKVYREKGDYGMAQHCYEQALLVDKGFFPAAAALEEIKKLGKKKKN